MIIDIDHLIRDIRMQGGFHNANTLFGKVGDNRTQARIDTIARIIQRMSPGGWSSTSLLNCFRITHPDIPFAALELAYSGRHLVVDVHPNMLSWDNSLDPTTVYPLEARRSWERHMGWVDLVMQPERVGDGESVGDWQKELYGGSIDISRQVDVNQFPKRTARWRNMYHVLTELDRIFFGIFTHRAYVGALMAISDAMDHQYMLARKASMIDTMEVEAGMQPCHILYLGDHRVSANFRHTFEGNRIFPYCLSKLQGSWGQKGHTSRVVFSGRDACAVEAAAMRLLRPVIETEPIRYFRDCILPQAWEIMSPRERVAFDCMVGTDLTSAEWG